METLRSTRGFPGGVLGGPQWSPRAVPVGSLWGPGGLGAHGQHVVAVAVAEVPGADLGAHVPTIERRRGELEPPDLQQQVGHGRQRVPAQPQLREPLQPGGHEGAVVAPSQTHTGPTAPSVGTQPQSRLCPSIPPREEVSTPIAQSGRGSASQQSRIQPRRGSTTRYPSRGRGQHPSIPARDEPSTPVSTRGGIRPTSAPCSQPGSPTSIPSPEATPWDFSPGHWESPAAGGIPGGHSPTHVGCCSGTSRTSSGGSGKSSGDSSGLCSSSGSTSKRPPPGVQPCWMQSWEGKASGGPPGGVWGHRDWGDGGEMERGVE